MITVEIPIPDKKKPPVLKFPDRCANCGKPKHVVLPMKLKGTIGSNCTITSQSGFLAESTLTGATTNYGFYSNIASGSGRWNFYASGTANNYFAGKVGIGSTSLTTNFVSISSEITGGTNAVGMNNAQTVKSEVTSACSVFRANPSTEAVDAGSSYTVTTLNHYIATQGTIGSNSAVTNQIGYKAESTITGGTNNYGFYGNIASAANRFNFYAAGTADNSFSGNVYIHGAGKLGYTTGSGGAVTQLTSRTTGVTLNKTNGAITLVSAAGSTSWQTFTVTNSKVAATDTVHVCLKSGTDLNMVHVTAVAAGSFNITFATTGGTTTEQPVFNFAVIHFRPNKR